MKQSQSLHSLIKVIAQQGGMHNGMLLLISWFKGLLIRKNNHRVFICSDSKRLNIRAVNHSFRNTADIWLFGSWSSIIIRPIP